MVHVSECIMPLGMANGAIPDSSIIASSYFLHSDMGYYMPQYARLRSDYNMWSSSIGDLQPWIQVDLGFSHRVTGFQVKGNQRDSAQYWVEQMEVQFGYSESDLTYIKDGNDQRKVCWFSSAILRKTIPLLVLIILVSLTIFLYSGSIIINNDN